MTMGEGGAVYTDNPILNRLILSYRDWGRDCICVSGQDDSCGHRYDGQFGELPCGYDHKYVYSHFGYNLIGTGIAPSISELIDFIWEKTEKKSIVNKGAVPMRLNEPDCIADRSEVLRILNYKPIYWKDGISKMIDEIRSDI